MNITWRDNVRDASAFAGKFLFGAGLLVVTAPLWLPVVAVIVPIAAGLSCALYSDDERGPW